MESDLNGCPRMATPDDFQLKAQVGAEPPDPQQSSPSGLGVAPTFPLEASGPPAEPAESPRSLFPPLLIFTLIIAGPDGQAVYMQCRIPWFNSGSGRS